jgi:hypothetical protein
MMRASREDDPGGESAAPSTDEGRRHRRSRGNRGRDRRVDLSAYEGLGAWIDIYDVGPWAHPTKATTRLRRRGVRTIFLQTSNYGARAGIVRPARVGRLLKAAHRRHMDVVAWYVPSFSHSKRDLWRSLRAIRFRSDGERFDGFGLDIEATKVSKISVRNRRLLRLSNRIRRICGSHLSAGRHHPRSTCVALLAQVPVEPCRPEVRRHRADGLFLVPRVGLPQSARVHDEGDPQGPPRHEPRQATNPSHRRHRWRRRAPLDARFRQGGEAHRPHGGELLRRTGDLPRRMGRARGSRGPQGAQPPHNGATTSRRCASRKPTKRGTRSAQGPPGRDPSILEGVERLAWAHSGRGEWPVGGGPRRCSAEEPW